jgi:hypothetical protein
MPLLVAGLGIGSPVWADDDHHRGENDRALRLLSLTPVPVSKANNTAGAMYVVDISFVDQVTQTFYVADRSNAAVDVVDAVSGKFLMQISASPAFKGVVLTGPGAANNNVSGPDGVVAAFPWLFVTDGGSRVVSFDLRTSPPTQVSDVTTNKGDANRADELAYDPEDGTLLVINNADTPPFGTLISVDKNTGKLTVGKRINLCAPASATCAGVDAQNGAEQPIWDPSTHRFYLSIPQIGPTVSNGGVIRINPATATVEATYPVSSCGPAGLSRGPGKDGRHDALIGCNTVFDTSGTTVWNPLGTVPADPRDVIIDLATGNIDAQIFGAGAGDEVWYNPGDNNYYATGSGSPLRPLPAATASGSTPLAVIDAADQKLDSLVPTFNVAAVTTGLAASQHPAGTSHSVAANSANNHVFVALPANNAILSPDGKTTCLTGCIAIFGHPDEDTDREADNDHHH